MNRDEARKIAAELGIPGRGKMTADQLREAIMERQAITPHANDPVYDPDPDRYITSAEADSELPEECDPDPKADGGPADAAERPAESTKSESPTPSRGPAKVSPRRSLVDSFTRMMARRAGAEGESPSPLDAGRRVANYAKQTGRRFQLTPKQARRVRQKLRRGASPPGPPAGG